MTTGYEVSMYRDISRAADALQRIAGALEALAAAQTRGVDGFAAWAEAEAARARED